MLRNSALIFLLGIFASATALSDGPVIDRPLPALVIADKGELLFENDEYSYQLWSSANNPGQVHVLQYFAGTKSGSKIFEPFTDSLQVEFPGGGYHVTTVINLDDAMWGTSGLVVSEVKASKQEFPAATIVLDDEGRGKKEWKLGKQGAVLAVMNKVGAVIFLTHDTLSEQETVATIALIKAQIEH